MAEGDAPRAVRLRRARPADAGALRRAHEAVLEVRYAAAFHDQAEREADDIISWVAVAAADPGAAAGPLAGAEEVVGFVTAKVRRRPPMVRRGSRRDPKPKTYTRPLTRTARARRWRGTGGASTWTGRGCWGRRWGTC